MTKQQIILILITIVILVFTIDVLRFNHVDLSRDNNYERVMKEKALSEMGDKVTSRFVSIRIPSNISISEEHLFLVYADKETGRKQVIENSFYNKERVYLNGEAVIYHMIEFTKIPTKDVSLELYLNDDIKIWNVELNKPNNYCLIGWNFVIRQFPDEWAAKEFLYE